MANRISNGFKRACCLLLCICVITGTALATAADGKTKLTVEYEVNNTHLSDATFRIYRVGDLDPYWRCSLSGDFADYKVAVDHENLEGWAGAALALAGYAAKDNRKEVASGKTDDKGFVVFDGLERGLYLVVGDEVQKGDTFYSSEPFLIALPGRGDNMQPIYEMTAKPKVKLRTIPNNDPGSRTVSRRALKVWSGEDGTETRPTSVTVNLLRNGRVYDSCKLSSKNSWRHTWSDLDAKYTWLVVEEEVPSGYTVSVNLEGVTFVLTNTYSPGKIPPNPPDGYPDNPNPPTPTPPTPDKPTPNNPTPTPNNPTPTTPTPRLPQTGLLWWPVPILVAGGLCFLFVGVLQRRKGKR